ncbi:MULTISPECIES: glycosyltransferase family 2 protein [Glaesserella]|uniref:Glycosyl transferase family 2 n=1 Tax=Glaesserella australis TaxID=2094024 RepID=A0A328BWQ2_9PAST|nr:MULTISPECIES: glycosyltransferase family 2 protein [Glaesserella]AUI67106.1 glycosyl transferase family 2 [Glaesserella sp. 15-184]RAL18151.1 glycosyl transferase family 2 [Glaesserella australis]
MLKNKKIAAVIPTFRVLAQIEKVLNKIPDYFDTIYVVDDKCDQGSGKFVQEHITDSRVRVIFHTENQGVGGAVISGYKQAILDHMDIVVKIDGDNQMDPYLAEKFILPIANGEADYTKGNRFFNLSDVTDMPKVRFFGNIALSFLTKASSGYWKIFDPTNGYTAISVKVLKMLPLEKIQKRYFFESDILFRLNLISAKVTDIPMVAIYGDEISNLKISKIFFPFLKGNLSNFLKRIFYKYFLQDFNVASLELIFGTIMTLFGTIFGFYNWISNAMSEIETPTGTIMISALFILVGIHLLLSFLSYDVNNCPTESISKSLNE